MASAGVRQGLVAAVVATACIVAGPAVAAASKGEPEIPRCQKRYGTLAVREPDKAWWVQLEVESPEYLLKALAAESNCFTLVDRGKGLAMAQEERTLAAGGELRGGSNIGKGQLRAADYVLVPDLVNRNEDAGGRKIGGLLGGAVGGAIGGALGNVNVNSQSAEVVLALTDARSSEQLSIQRGRAKKSDLGWDGAGGGVLFGVLTLNGASGYARTPIGRVIATAYVDAYARLVQDVQQLAPDARADNAEQAVVMIRPGRMFVAPELQAEVVQDLDPNMLLYPTGQKQGVWWQVADELGNEGWVPSTSFQPAR